MRRNELVTILLIVVAVGVWRQISYRKWLDGLGRLPGVSVSIEVAENPQKNWSGATFNDRGVKWVCPSKVAGCSKAVGLQLGDNLIIHGRQTDIKVMTIEKVIGLTKLQPVPVIDYWWWRRYLNDLQIQINNNYRLLLGEPYAGLMSGIVLGTQNQLDRTFYQALVITGTMHVVAASGFNITMAAGAIMGVSLLFMKRKWAIGLTILLTTAYVGLCGGGPSVVRAGIMGVMALTGQAIGKPYWARWSLIITSLLMLIWSPWLIESVSFQLSVAATAGIIWGQRQIQKIFGSIQGKLWLRVPRGKRSFGESLYEATATDLSTTLAATLATLPITLITFGQVSVIAPLVNVLVLWLIPPLMVLGGLIAGISLVISGLGQVLAWLAWAPLFLFVWLVQNFSQVSWSLMSLPGLTWIFGWGWWLLLLVGWTKAETD